MKTAFSPILDSEPALLTSQSTDLHLTPGVAVVYTDAYGSTVEEADTPKSWLGRWRMVRWTRHLVDVGDHRISAVLKERELPSQGDALFFEASLDIGFRVTNPCEVVRRNATFSDETIVNYVVDELRIITREYDIEMSRDAESRINKEFGAGIKLPCGITIFHLGARLVSDSASREYIVLCRQEVRQSSLNLARHVEAVNTAERENQIKQIQHAAEISRSKTALDEMNKMALDPYQLLLAHVAAHPQDAEGTFDLLMRVWEAGIARDESRDNRANDLLRYLIERGVIQAVDVERFRDELTDHVRRSSSARRYADPGWDQPPVLPNVRVRKASEKPPEAERNSQ